MTEFEKFLQTIDTAALNSCYKGNLMASYLMISGHTVQAKTAADKDNTNSTAKYRYTALKNLKEDYEKIFDRILPKNTPVFKFYLGNPAFLGRFVEYYNNLMVLEGLYREHTDKMIAVAMSAHATPAHSYVAPDPVPVPDLYHTSMAYHNLMVDELTRIPHSTRKA